MTKITDLHKQWLKRPGYKKAFDDSQAEFELAHHIIQTRINSGLSQDELAQKMETSQSSIARLESGTSLPSMRTLTKFAKATNTEINISFKPVKTQKAKMRAWCHGGVNWGQINIVYQTGAHEGGLGVSLGEGLEIDPT